MEEDVEDQDFTISLDQFVYKKYSHILCNTLAYFFKWNQQVCFFNYLGNPSKTKSCANRTTLIIPFFSPVVS